MITFLSLLIFGFIHVAMLATTKYLVSYAAFSVSRTAMVNGNRQLAAIGALQYLRWSAFPPVIEGPRRTARSTREGFLVSYRVPFVPPGVSAVPRLTIYGFSPFVRQRAGDGLPADFLNREKGDNAEN